jgi:hypothetical protein
MYTGTLVEGRGVKSQVFNIHPKNQMLVIGQEDNLIYQLVSELPEMVICAYELEDGVNGMFANYAEDGEYNA